MRPPILFVALIASGYEQGLDKAPVAGLLESVYGNCMDVSCEYEGKIVFPQYPESTELGPGGLYDDFSGSFLSRRDGASLVDIFHRQYPGLALLRETIAMKDGRCEVYTRMTDDPYGAGVVDLAHFKRLDQSGSLGRIMCDQLVLGFLRSDEWLLADEKTEVMDGHTCQLLTFTYLRDPQVGERIWIDLRRGGHALKREVFNGSDVVQRMQDVQLEAFEDANGERVWLPIRGHFDSFLALNESGETVYSSDPTNHEEYFVLRESVRVNSQPADEKFSVTFREGTRISDQLRRVQYEFGRADPSSKPLTQAETEAMLKQQLLLAESQKQELQAASRLRISGSNWSRLAPWTLAIVSSVALLVLAIRRIRS